MGWQVVVQEFLSSHQVEWEIVSSPADEKETQGVVKSGSGCGGDDVVGSSASDEISKDKSNVHGEETNLNPETNDISNEEDLSSGIVIVPERNTGDGKRPGIRLRGKWML